MKRVFWLVALFLSASAAFAATTTQKWTAGWDTFNAPLNYKKSHVSWSVNPKTSKLSVTFTLVGGTPNQFYAVGLNFFCSTFPTTFGQFPTEEGTGGNCASATRQGVTETIAVVTAGVVTTDINGNGSFTVVIGPIAAGTYDLEFYARGGAGSGPICVPACPLVDFQSPGPTFGDATTITIP
jgi:hypothetical protein